MRRPALVLLHAQAHWEMKRLPFFAVLGLAFGIGSPAAAPPEAASAPRAVLPTVVLLFAQRTTAPAVVTMDEAFRREIERSYEGPVDLHVEYLDLPDAGDKAYVGQLVELLRGKYAGLPVRVVVAVRSECVSFALQNRGAIFPGACFKSMPAAAMDSPRGLWPYPPVTGMAASNPDRV